MSARSQHIRLLPCIACDMEKAWADAECCLYFQPSPTEEHHLNLGGKAGQKRRGDDHSIPLCGWHHRGEPPMNMTATDALFHHGPSLARTSKLFRDTYGSDDALLERTNGRMATT